MGMPVIVASNIDRCEAVTDIIQSVALEQAALAHILNAEGEKIQKIVALDGATADEMLEVNKSVKSMVESISNLEMILQSKLGLFEDCLCTTCPCESLETLDIVLIESSNNMIIAPQQVDNNQLHWLIKDDVTAFPATFEIKTTPSLPLQEIQLPDGVTLNDNVLSIANGAALEPGETAFISVGEGKCAQQLRIDINATGIRLTARVSF